MKIVTKPWGYEKWLDINGKYVLKEIFMGKGYRSSLQFHQVKLETIYVLRGVGTVYTELSGKKDLITGDVILIPPYMVHRVEAVTDLLMIEASTPEVDDIIRVEDDFCRGDGRIASEHSDSSVGNL